jgi:hypothetical protein
MICLPWRATRQPGHKQGHYSYLQRGPPETGKFQAMTSSIVSAAAKQSLLRQRGLRRSINASMLQDSTRLDKLVLGGDRLTVSLAPVIRHAHVLHTTKDQYAVTLRHLFARHCRTPLLRRTPGGCTFVSCFVQFAVLILYNVGTVCHHYTTACQPPNLLCVPLVRVVQRVRWCVNFAESYGGWVWLQSLSVHLPQRASPATVDHCLVGFLFRQFRKLAI